MTHRGEMWNLTKNLKHTKLDNVKQLFSPYNPMYGRSHTIKIAKILSIMENYNSKSINWSTLKSSDLITCDDILDPEKFSREVWDELEFWLKLDSCETDIWRYGRHKATASIYTDASNLRFGIRLEDINIGGSFEPEFEFSSIALKLESQLE